MKKRMLTLILLGAMLCSMVLTGCSESSDGGETTTAADTTVTGGEETTTGEALPAGPEVVDYEGYTFRIHSNNSMEFTEIDIEEITGDIVKDSIYERNRAIEADYNITFDVTYDGEMYETFPIYVQAGEDFTDLTFLPCFSLFKFAQDDYLRNWNEVDGIMLDADWWDKRAFDQLSIGDKFYTLFGDISTHEDIVALILHYNKDMYNEFGFENAYDMVNSGTWTFDKFWEMVTTVSQDLDGDGKMTPSDRFGLLSEYSAFTYFYAGAGYKTIDMSGDSFVLNTSNERAYDIVNKLSVIATEKNKNSLIADDGTVEGSYTTSENMFREGRGLFRSAALDNMIAMRDAEGDYGVLPIPKYEETQDSYYNLVSWGANALVLPTSVTDEVRSSSIADALSYRSMIETTDVFFNVFLDEKAMRDEESKGMLDIIFDTKSYDLDWYASVSGFTVLLGDIAKSGQNNFASAYAAIEEAAESKLADFVAAFDD